MFLIGREDFLKPGLLSSIHVFQNNYKSHPYEAGKDRRSIRMICSRVMGTRIEQDGRGTISAHIALVRAQLEMSPCCVLGRKREWVW